MKWNDVEVCTYYLGYRWKIHGLGYVLCVIVCLPINSVDVDGSKGA